MLLLSACTSLKKLTNRKIRVGVSTHLGVLSVRRKLFFQMLENLQNCTVETLREKQTDMWPRVKCWRKDSINIYCPPTMLERITWLMDMQQWGRKQTDEIRSDVLPAQRAAQPGGTEPRFSIAVRVSVWLALIIILTGMIIYIIWAKLYGCAGTISACYSHCYYVI